MHKTTNDGADDRFLLDGLRARDERALGEVHRLYGDAVIAVASRVVGNRSDAEDVAQETFFILWSRSERVDLERGSLASFLLTVARRRAIDVVRSEQARRRREESVGSQNLAWASWADPDPVANSALESDSARELAEALDTVVRVLPEEQRVPIELAYFGSHTYRQVSAALAIPEGTTKSRIRAGLAGMRHAPEIASTRAWLTSDLRAS
jgi:RNA polymerase sigma-70 factor (ECF subfamily)